MVLGLVMVKLRLTQDDHDPIESGYQFNLIAVIISVMVVCYGFSLFLSYIKLFFRILI